MKNFKLLLATTAILSTGLAMGAMAVPPLGVIEAELSTQIHAEATLTTAISITEEQRLNFGEIINPDDNQVVVVKSDGTLGSGTTATVIASYSGYDHTGIKAGKITILNAFDDSGVTGVNLQGDQFEFEFPETITLTGQAGNKTITCGTVSEIGNDDGDIINYLENDKSSSYLTYGGKLTLANNIKTEMPANSSVKCEGTGTVTLIYTYVEGN